MTRYPSGPAPCSTRAIQIDGYGNLDEDIPCRKCGQNLRGHPSQLVCSQCGTAIGRTLIGDLLLFSDPKWLRSLVRGMDLILIGFIIAFFSSCIIGFTIATGGLTNGIAGICQFAAGILPLIGYWKLTKRDPARLDNPRLTAYRLTVRFTSILNFLGGPVQFLVPFVGLALTGLLSAASGLIYLLWTYAIFTFFRLMALRIPDERLERSTLGLMWFSLVLMLISVATMVLFTVRPPVVAPENQNMVTSAAFNFGLSNRDSTEVTEIKPTLEVAGYACLYLLLALVVLIWTIILFFRYRGAFQDAAILALKTWAAPARPKVTDFGPGFAR